MGTAPTREVDARNAASSVILERENMVHGESETSKGGLLVGLKSSIVVFQHKSESEVNEVEMEVLF